MVRGATAWGHLRRGLAGKPASAGAAAALAPFRDAQREYLRFHRNRVYVHELEGSQGDGVY